MRPWTLRLLAPVLLALATVPAGALAASTGPSSNGNTGSDPVTPITDSVNATSTSVEFKGRVFVRNVSSSYQFRYGVDDGSVVSHQTQLRGVSAPNTQTTVSAAESISDLQPGTAYVVELVAKATSGSDTSLRSGGVLHFTTPGSSGSGSSGSGSSGSGSSGSGSSGSGSAKPIVTSPPVGGTLPFDQTKGDDSAKSTSKPPAATSTPVNGQSAGAAPASGTVLVKQPGTNRYVELKAGDVVPMGSVIDTRAGTVALTTALPSGKKQTGHFNGGLFQVKQGRGGYADLYLRGALQCPGRVVARRSLAAASLASASGKRRSGRRLFGRDHGGRFRTHGRNSQATVRGTRWLTEDRCDGTLTSVSQGAVSVRDFARKRSVLVRAGGRYLARAHR